MSDADLYAHMSEEAIFAFNISKKTKYHVRNIRHVGNFTLLRVREISNDRHPKILPLAFEHSCFDRPIDIAVGDKIEFEAKINEQELYDDYIDLEGYGVHMLLAIIKRWKPNVVSIEGWRNLKRPQTRFKPRCY